MVNAPRLEPSRLNISDLQKHNHVSNKFNATAESEQPCKEQKTQKKKISFSRRKSPNKIVVEPLLMEIDMDKGKTCPHCQPSWKEVKSFVTCHYTHMLLSQICSFIFSTLYYRIDPVY